MEGKSARGQKKGKVAGGQEKVNRARRGKEGRGERVQDDGNEKEEKRKQTAGESRKEIKEESHGSKRKER